MTVKLYGISLIMNLSRWIYEIGKLIEDPLLIAETCNKYHINISNNFPVCDSIFSRKDSSQLQSHDNGFENQQLIYLSKSNNELQQFITITPVDVIKATKAFK